MSTAYIEGIVLLTNVFMAIVGGIIASIMFRQAWSQEALKAWRPLIFALIVFALQEIIGALRAFDIFSTPYLTHVVPSIILGLLITAVVLEIDVKKRGLKIKNGTRTY